MHEIPPPFFVLPFVVLPLMLMQLAWYVAVIVFLYKIWKKVKHLPGDTRVRDSSSAQLTSVVRAVLRVLNHRGKTLSRGNQSSLFFLRSVCGLCGRRQLCRRRLSAPHRLDHRFGAVCPPPATIVEVPWEPATVAPATTIGRKLDQQPAGSKQKCFHVSLELQE